MCECVYAFSFTKHGRLCRRWTPACKVPVASITKDSNVLRCNETDAQIYVDSTVARETAPNTHTFAIVPEFLCDLRLVQLYINYGLAYVR